MHNTERAGYGWITETATESLLRQARLDLAFTNSIANLESQNGGGNVLGETRDLTVLGDAKSSLGPQLAPLIGPRDMRIAPDANPERGFFYSSDRSSLAKVGVPSVNTGTGDDYVGRPREWGHGQSEDYTVKRLHQVTDEYEAT